MRCTLLLLAACLPACADLTWTLDGVTFDDGAVATGFVTFNDAGTVGGSVAVSGGTLYPALTYDASNSHIGGDNTGAIFTFNSPVANPRALVLILDSLSPTAGPLSIGLRTASPNPSRECDSCDPFRLITAGSVDITGSITSWDVYKGVPEPSSLTTVVGFMVLLLIAKRHRLRSQPS